jgi:hypothetical protein
MMARRTSSRRWIQGAIKRPGQLKRDLGIPQNEKIPTGLLRKAAKEPGKIGQRARLALQLRGANPRRRATNPRRRRTVSKQTLIPAKLKRMANGRYKVLVSPGTLERMRIVRINPRKRKRRR